MLVSLFKRLRAAMARDGHAGIKHTLHDPRWGHRLEDGRKAQEGRRPGKNNNNDNEGPPDLDQLWRDFNQRLNRLFGTVRDAAQSVVRGMVGTSKMDYVLYEGRDHIAAGASDRIQQMADRYALGAEIVGVTVLSATVPDAVAPAFEETVKAREDRS